MHGRRASKSWCARSVSERAETDANGIVTTWLARGAKSTLKGRRVRRRPGAPLPLDTLPAGWRALLTRWLRRGERIRWDTLRRDVGSSQIESAHNLREWLLRAGWISVEETRERGLWQTRWLSWTNSAALRQMLGLPDPTRNAAAWQALRNSRFSDTRIQAVAAALDALPPARAVMRHALLLALDTWQAEQRFGTRRDFALFARADTKAITPTEWTWLDQQLGLSNYGVDRHSPMLCIRAPLVLTTPHGQISLAASPDFIGLSLNSAAAASGIDGSITAWRVVENRTSFERVAREYGQRDAVIWLPGFAPGWWKQSVGHLLRLMPAPALIACDPDPAGVEIALDAAGIWQAAGLPWQAWQMDAARLAALPRRKPLTERDRQRLSALRQLDLPDTFRILAEWMATHGEKGEQEGFL